MRASKTSARRKDVHISGAEGLYDAESLAAAGAKYIARAVKHPRGLPDTICITIEKLQAPPIYAPLLPVRTQNNSTPEVAWSCIVKYLSDLGISESALSSAHRILKSKDTMRGAALISADSGKRLDPDKKRGVRVSRIGIETGTDRRLSKALAPGGINTTTVKEALTLASKAVHCKDVLAEICVSDDPDYTTGYIASLTLGYLRIPNIKLHGDMRGGRVFFLRPGADTNKTIKYLEETAVLVTDKIK